MGVFDIATIGTSLTAGNATTQSYHRDLEALLQPGKSHAVTTYNFGIPGSYTTDGLANIARPVAMRPKAVLIEYSMNDCLKAFAAVRSDTLTLINTLKTALPSSMLFLMIMNPVVGTGSSALMRGNLPTFYQLYRDLAASESVGLIDTTSAWSGVVLSEIPDGVHPTSTANRTRLVPAIASALAGVIT